MKEQTQKLIDHYKLSKAKSDLHQSKLINEILGMEGMTSAKTRHFYNNLLDLQVADRKLKYLEIGTWKGSSLISALYGNKNVQAVCIDNWSEFQGPRIEFFSNCQRFLDSSYELRIIEQDCFNVNIEDKFDIYMYDGHHSHEAQLKAITHFEKNLNDSCILVVDDWNDLKTRSGTEDGIKQTNFEVKFKDEVFSRFNADLEGYWNGMGIFVLERKI